MKFVCPQSDINTHLSLVSRAVPARPSKPVLSNVLVKADIDAQEITLVGFDETFGIQTTFAAAVEIPGEITLPAKLLDNIVSKLPSEPLTVEQADDDYTVSLVCSTGQYQVRGLSAEDYPSLPLVEDGQVTQLSAESLLEGLRGTLFASSSDESRQILTGGHILSDGYTLEFAATDGHRLSVVKISDENSDGMGQMSVTLPAKSLRELEKMLQAYEAANPVILSFTRTMALFELGPQRLTTRLLEGQYPNYRQLVPKEFERSATVNRKALISALERIAVLAEQKNNIIKLSLSDGAIAITVEATEVGNGREDVQAETLGKPLDTAFNVRYLLDGLKALGSNEVQMKFNTATSPSVLCPVGTLDTTYLIMPVQIRS